MGDRALVVFTDRDESEFSPAAYLHWGGGAAVVEMLQKAVPRMRNGDVGYSCARFIGVCHEDMDGNCSLGCFNGPKDLAKAKSKDFSHGDAGVFLVNVGTWEVKSFNGYGFGLTNNPDYESQTMQLETPPE